ncbi:LapA family protein [Brachybacterium sp. J153]|uniref:LapA family protein n=1 Tax=Brachybacterium sp. J153 TaxID=3116488 RepID=UPI002E77C2FE|nr:LapA family protein [Brachybacterium sp. J153]MEE1619472.1 LapA family protein [Brachybacterium sp. J153]
MSIGPENPDQPVRRAPEPPRPAAETAPSDVPQTAGAPTNATEAPAAPPSAVAPTSSPTGRRAAPRPDAPEPVVEEPVDTSGGGKTAGMWIGLILGAVVLVLLLIFVIQNNVTARFQYFGAEFDLPLGVAMLLAAIAGALVMALVGSVRMIQMSWTIRKLRKQQEKVRRVTR